MFDLDGWHEIWVSLRRNPTRTLLTAFGVFWGMFMLVVLLGSGKGLENGALAGFGDGATNSFFLWSRSTSKPFAGFPVGRQIRMTNADTEAIRAEVPTAAVVAPRNQLGGFMGGNNVVRGLATGAFSVMGDYPEVLTLQSLEIVRGRFVNHLDLAELRKVAVIGSRVREVLYEIGEDPVGTSIRINGVYFEVVGEFATKTSGPRSQRDAETIYVPFTTFQRVFNFGDRVGWFAITSVDNVPASVVEDQVKALLRERHKVAPDDTRAIGSFNLEKEFMKFKGLFLGIQTLIWIVGIGTLAAGVIGVSNIMLVIVKERTREIGLRRAIGATPLSITRQIVLESVLLTGTAGWLGLTAGVGVLELVRTMISRGSAEPGMFQNPGVAFSDALSGLVVLIVAGILAGLVPSQRAIAITPVEALRAD